MYLLASAAPLPSPVTSIRTYPAPSPSEAGCPAAASRAAEQGGMAGGEKRAGRLAAEPLLAPVIVSHTTPDDVPAGGVYTFVRSPREAACSTTTATSVRNRPASPRAARAAAHDDPANLLTQDMDRLIGAALGTG